MMEATEFGTTVTVMITTFNRWSELRRTLEKVSCQTWPSVEVIVVDDASPDDTFRNVQKLFPWVHVRRNERNKGSIANRNDILRLAQGSIVVALDDDSWFMDDDAIEKVVNRFSQEPDLGILGFQIVGPENPETLDPAARRFGSQEVSSFVACGAAIRRSVLSQTGLFPEFFHHAYEEPDLALRVWDAGYRVVRWDDIVVYHEFSGLNRNEIRTHRRHARNEACSVIMRYPLAWIPFGLPRKLAGQALYAYRRGWNWLLQEPRVWFEFLALLPSALRHRRAVKASTLRKVWKMNLRTEAFVRDEAMK